MGIAPPLAAATIAQQKANFTLFGERMTKTAASKASRVAMLFALVFVVLTAVGGILVTAGMQRSARLEASERSFDDLRREVGLTAASTQ